MSGTCLIAPNPDVAGIGVRIAIYAQNFLGFFPALAALRDKHVDEVELDALEAQSTTILIMALAILVTTIVEAAKNDFINYHTSIVLSLSWINNTNTFLYFLLWLHRKTTLSQERHNEATYSNEIEISVESPSISEHSAFTIEEERKVFDAKRELSSRLSQPAGIGNMGWWLDTLRTSLNTLARGEKRAVALSNANRGVDTIVNKEDTLLRQAQVTFQNTIDDVYASFHQLNAVFLLGSIHLTLMSAVGIWLWHSPTSFGASPPCSAAKQINLLGHPVHIGSLPLQIISLIMYSIFLVPFLNLVLPMAAITSLYIFCNRSRSSVLFSLLISS
ncbi:hypothetical protein DL96DRAFT_394445 [Flagelloscypha sp. PMI_526]|nr:hypothetical protein DL96DRAFT_394445 [Flagelloscypha sp. PMI_526]